jgi:hypothetical protein
MSFNPQDVKSVDGTAKAELGMQYPLLQWVNGSPQGEQVGGVSYTGGWFAQSEPLDLNSVEGWTQYTMTHRDGSSTDGFASVVLPMAVIRRRQRWEAYTESGPRKVWPWDRYEQAREEGFRPRARTHLFCMVRGVDEPVVVTLPGTIGRYVTEQENTFRRAVLGAANQASADAGVEGRWNPWHFWMPLGAPMFGEKGNRKPRFTTVGSGNQTSQITTPLLWGVPSKATDVTKEALDKLYVGSDNITAFDNLWHESKDWQEMWGSAEALQEQENEWAKEARPESPLVVEQASIDEVEEVPW